ncbi:YdcF family protein [Tsukamurella serpentis]
MYTNVISLIPARRSIAAAVMTALVALFGLGIDRMYVQPPIANPHPADAIVVLGGNPYDRFEYGLELAQQGLAAQVVISNSVGPTDQRMRELCSRAIDRVEVSCFLPVPWSTRGEAQEIRRLAKSRGWKDIIVVTTTAHLQRARFIVRRCYGAELQMMDFPERRSTVDTVLGWGYQSAGWVKALYQNGC